MTPSLDTAASSTAMSWRNVPLAVPGSQNGMGWAHPGMAYSEGLFYTTDPLDPVVIGFDTAGNRMSELAVDARDIHAIVVGSDKAFWLADPGKKECRADDGHYATRVVEAGGQILQYGRDGLIRLRIGAPEHDAYRLGAFRPTSLALAADAVWVADGYGQNLVHRFDLGGNLLATFDGGQDSLDVPHSILLDRRGDEERLLVADRDNSRILVLDPSTCDVVSVIGQGVVDRPCGMEIWNGYLVVADLHGRVTVFDDTSTFVRHIGETGPATLTRPGWPNALDGGRNVRPQMASGKFNAPHDIAIAPDGLLAVCEWVIGGRLTLLRLADLLP
jgi:hypothetical protein